MKILLIELNKVIESSRLDFDFFCPYEENEISLADGYRKDTLANLCTYIGTGKTAPRNAYPEIGVRILKVKNLKGNGIDWEPKFFVTEEFYASAEKKARVYEGDILMLCSAHNKIYIGRCDIITRFPKDIQDDSNRCLCVGEIIIIRANPQQILSDYLVTYLRLPIVQEKIRRMVKGQTAHLYPQDLRRLEVIIPPRKVQKEIAEMNIAAEEEYRTRIRDATEEFVATQEIIKNLILNGNV